MALTGNIASGKSEVARRLAQHGALVIDADVLAREVVEPGAPAWEDIVAHWGRSVLLPDDSIDRAALRRRVFDDPEARAALERIVHPRVGERRAALLHEARARGARVVVSDIPLLFETGLQDQFDRVVLVDAPESVRLARLREHRGLDEAEARRMIAAQMPSGVKRDRADHVIDNAGTLEALAARVDEVWAALERDA